jgi:hypothetical protein
MMPCGRRLERIRRNLYDEGAWRKRGQSQVECGRKMIDHRQYAPPTVRNRDFILDVLRDVLPMTGVILEIASGSGDASFILREISRVSLSNLPILNRKPC